MATVLISPQEYLRSSYEPDAEYVDGHIEERPVGEFDHASWQQALQFWFRDRPEWNLRTRAELRVQVAEARFRVPDVTVLDRRLPAEQIVTIPPVAVFEVLSPEDTVNRLLVKLADYQAMGIRNILVIDPAQETFYRYRNGALTPSPEVDPLAGTQDATLNWQGIGALRD